MPDSHKEPTHDSTKAPAQLTARVTRILEFPTGMWAEVIIDGAGDLYREIRVPTPVLTTCGTELELKAGDRVTICIELIHDAQTAER